MTCRILLLTFFYPPDLSAGSFRASALVERLQRYEDAGVQLDVLTTQPNRYTDHSVEAVSMEELPGLRIKRVRLPMIRQGFVGQALSFVRYARKVHRLTSSQEYDIVVATSSRLMTAALGAWVAYRRRSYLYLDIRDIFVESLPLLFRYPLGSFLGLVFGAVERWTVGRADRVNLVSRGFLEYFQRRYPGRAFSLFSNGVDDAFVNLAATARGSAREAVEPIQVLYAGNLGDGQGMHLILPELARRLGPRVRFRIVGAGGRLDVLRDYLQASDLDNVELLPPVAREDLLELYRGCDVLFLHLNDYPAFKRVLPSKLFEYAATGKPIWAGVAGYAAEFIAAELTKTAVFAPCDAEAALESFERLELGLTDRAAFVQRYARERIMDEMAQDILQLLEPA